eukprot:Pompholyxophrys_sp_v1_NODE_3_length_18401_cov_4.332280.p7 type:complete len:193 gc:universal NODE_3_length_18401_cov_4.332280:1966-2544(+)
MSEAEAEVQSEKIECKKLKHQCNLLRDILERICDDTNESMTEVLKRERDLLSDILKDMKVPTSKCQCGEYAYYWDHNDDDKVKCKKCRNPTCVKCIVNNCEYCDNFYNITCKSCNESNSLSVSNKQSRLCEQCNKLYCRRCKNCFTCSVCFKEYHPQMCPECFIGKSPEILRKCPCGQTVCRDCVCFFCTTF